MKPTGWSTPFEGAIRTPSGGRLSTLRQAAEYMRALPASEQARPEWQQAAVYLAKAAEDDRAWRWFARSAVVKALADPGEPAPRPRARSATWRDKRAAWLAAGKPKRGA